MRHRTHPLRRKLGRDLWHQRGPFLAVALVAAAGVVLFISLRSMHGYLTSAQSDYYRSERFAQVFAHMRRAPLHAADRVAALPGVATVEARIVTDALVEVAGLREPAVGRLVSLPADREPSLNRVVLRRGRRFVPGESGVALVSDAFCRANGLQPGDSLGVLLRGRWQRLRIVGTASSPEFIYEIRGGADIFPDNRRFGVLWLPEEELQWAFGLRGAFNDLALGLAPGASARDVVRRLDELLEPYGGTGAYDREDQVSHRFVSDEILETQVTSIFLPSLLLGVTAFLLHLVMSRLVALERDQIAVLKAFGYSDGAVAAHYLALALVPVGAGAAAGVAVGLWLALELAGVYARFFQFPSAVYRPDLVILLAGALIACGAAALGALAAVRRAVALPPAEAMRPEAPERFRTGWLERSGLLARLRVPARIVARHLVRRPLRSALSVLGIAIAVGIIVTGGFLFDALDYMQRLQFEHVQRETVSVSFHEPLSAAALRAVAHLPGVLRAEPWRAVAVRLRNPERGYLEHRIGLFGLAPGGELRQIVDGELRAHPVPPEGLLLSAALGRRLELPPGSLAQVEVLEARRPIRLVRVVGWVDELLGLNAYMTRDAVNRLLGEGDVVSGALVLADPAGEAALYDRLKRLPAVSGMAIRAAMLAGFRRTIAESFYISIAVILGFACLVAAGMVYNGARVALSERARELASLRVLGFSRREVANMLLGEQAVLTLAALPAGVLLGIGLCVLTVRRFESELFRIPVIVSGATIAFALVVVLVAAALSALAVRRRTHRLDLVAVLKTRE
ncbi:MAG: FtsX-like permease family protein [Acidobacteriota bacterium]